MNTKRGRPVGHDPANRIHFRLDPESARMLRELNRRGTMTTLERITWMIHRDYAQMMEADALYPDRVGGPNWTAEQERQLHEAVRREAEESGE